MSDREQCRQVYLEMKRMTTFFFDLAMDEPSKHLWLAKYSYWRDRETKAHKIYMVHLFR